MKLYVIHDHKAEAYTMPQASRNNETMKRELTQLKGTIYQDFPSDYTLYEIGSYDEITATLVPYDKHRPVCSLADIFLSDQRAADQNDLPL